MIDNFEKISKMLKFESEDDFYFCQILKRKKEHPELGSNSYVVKTYYISSLEALEFYKDEMICLAKHHNARIGINLNKRSFEKTAFNTLKKISDQIMNRDYKSCRKSYSSVCGSISSEKDKKWIVDIDHKNMREINTTLTFIERECNPIGVKFINMIETKNGYHLITSPFNRKQFSDKYSDIEIQIDNPTLIYIS